MNNASFHSWYDAVYPFLSEAGIWLSSGSLNTKDPATFHEHRLKILFTRLSTFRDTGSSFTMQLLYQIASEREGVFPDCAFLPPPKDVELFDSHAVPWLLGVNTKLGPFVFDIIGFSNSVVQELLNLPLMLMKSGISLSKKERMLDPGMPLILLGGSNACATSLLWTDDPVVDGICTADDHRYIKKILDLCIEAKNESLTKTELLTRLESVPGFFQPDRLPKQTLKNPKGHEVYQLKNGPVFFHKEQIGTGHLQITYGCPLSCNFCFEGATHKPYGEIPARTLAGDAGLMKQTMGIHDMELFSFNFNMHSDLPGIIESCIDLGLSIGLKSQRFDMIARNPGLVPLLKTVGKTSITCAIEGISQRLRNYLHKDLDPETILKSFSILFHAKIRELKIFLIATGHETDRDFDEFKALLQQLQQLAGKDLRHRPRIIFSITPLVRFPLTPLEFDTAFPPDHYVPIVNAIGTIVRGRRFEFRMSNSFDDYWISQVFARCTDPRVIVELCRMQQESPSVVYETMDPSWVCRFRQRLDDAGIDRAALLKGADHAGNAPWDLFRTGSERETLYKTFNRSLGCLHEKTSDRYSKSVKPDVSGTAVSMSWNSMTEYTAYQSRISAIRERIDTGNRNKKECSFHVFIDSSKRGVPRSAVGEAIAAALMVLDPSLIPSYGGYGGSWCEERFGTSWIYGDDLITLFFGHSGFEALQSSLARNRIDCNLRLHGWCSIRSCPTRHIADPVLECRSPYAWDPTCYLSTHNLNATVRKTYPQGRIYEFSKDALKKKIFRNLSAAQDETSEATIRCVPGEKFNLIDFIQETFVLPHPQEWVRVRSMVSFE